MNEVLGSGPKDSTVAIIGEAPGFYEDREGKPFVGKSGQLLRESLRRVGINPDDCYITNVIKIRPEGNRTPTTPEIKAALPALAVELGELPNLRTILLVGSTPFFALTSLTGITKHRGLVPKLRDEFQHLSDINIFATIHPASVLRNSNYRNGWLADLGAFAQLVHPPVEEPYVQVIHPDLVEGLLATLAAHDTGAIDIETTIADPFTGDIKLISVGVYFGGEAFVLTCDEHPEGTMSREEILSILQEHGSHIKWVMHNGAFDQLVLSLMGVDLHLEHDTMAMAYLLHQDERKGLEILSSLYLGLPPYKGIDYERIMEESMEDIAGMNGKDAARTLMLFRPLADKINEDKQLLRLYKNLLMPAVRTLIEVTKNGVPVDQEALEQLTKTVGEEVEALDEAVVLHAEAAGFENTDGKPFNPRSPLQVGKLLYEMMQLPVIKHTDTGAPSTDKEVLSELLLLPRLEEAQSQFLTNLSDLRTAQRNQSTYIKGWPEFIDENNMMHPRYKPLFVTTGRLSSERPNIQNVPRKDKRFRMVFGGRQGEHWVSADYSQLELRIAAWVSRDDKMLDTFQSGKDIHSMTALHILGNTSDEARYVAKTINFGLLYGAGSERLRKIALQEYNLVLTSEQAKQYRAEFFRLYPGLKEYYSRIEREVRKTGQVRSPLGRVRQLPDINSPDEGLQWKALREGINHPIQSLGSDLLLMALVRLAEVLPKNEIWPVAEVHDEIDFLATDAGLGNIPTIREVMQDTAWLSDFGIYLDVPVIAEVKVGSHWGNTKEITK